MKTYKILLIDNKDFRKEIIWDELPNYIYIPIMPSFDVIPSNGDVPNESIISRLRFYRCHEKIDDKYVYRQSHENT